MSRTTTDNAQWWLGQAVRYEAVAAQLQSPAPKEKWLKKAADARASAIACASCVE